jgi:hypothetical protein
MSLQSYIRHLLWAVRCEPVPRWNLRQRSAYRSERQFVDCRKGYRRLALWG